MPSPIPPTRLLPKDLFPSADISVCSSPLQQRGLGATLQVPPQRLHGKLGSRPWSSVIHWQQLRCVEAVGSGGFGSVYRAEYLGQTVALKKVKRRTKNRLASRQSFWAELNAAHLSHRNVVRVLAASTCVPADFQDEGSIGAIVMEFVGSRNLQQVIYESPEPLEEARCLRFSSDMAEALRFLHAHLLVHLDVKPPNVLLSPGGVCKLADFGCSLQLERERAPSSISPLLSHGCGTYSHRAPELLRGQPVTPKADIFSLGITMWQLLTREPPYTGDRQHVLYAVVARDLRPSLSHAVFASAQGRRRAELLGRCWSAEVRRRPSAEELLELLRSA
ncbi:proto-oncogene serine/threonine-protein kinase mos [Cyprinodon tularosa]|uniref:proto-oncogene serine/threonine-protein kinase mos n=1 Tax=Cyprinodon tularosa TaxID=77115 RepID=UPI0018E25DB0|nr:proto-oncogene serine/threonine-protein kinase mos [Cyprinodon tularosa]